MKNNKPGASDGLNDLLEEIGLLIKKGDNEKVITESNKGLKTWGPRPMLYAALSLGYSAAGKYSDAMRTLKLAEEKFPGEFEILHELARLYQETADYENAEKYFLRSIESVPAELGEVRSIVHNGLGCLYWRQDQADKAEEQWKKALVEYPQNIKAKKNLDELIYTDSSLQSGENSLIKNLFLFRSIQTDKYLELKNKMEFTTIKEAKRITEIIAGKFMEKFSSGAIDLDSMPLKEKTELFYEIEIDF
jgi:tetratricopeptide (TPR) repeat protein